MLKTQIFFYLNSRNKVQKFKKTNEKNKEIYESPRKLLCKNKFRRISK